MIKIIPAIDIIDGKCVRLTKGDYNAKKIYNEYPVEVAKQFQDAGIERLHLVDLDGAKAGCVTNWKVLESIAENTNLKIDFSGGITTSENINTAFKAGAMFISVGSIAVNNRQLFTDWILKFGADKFLLAADVRNEIIVTKGWTETTTLNVNDFIASYTNTGVKQVFCTDVEMDGMMNGPSIELYKNILNRNPDIHLIASGGVRSKDDILKLEATGCAGVIIGKAIYEGTIKLEEIKNYAY